MKKILSAKKITKTFGKGNTAINAITEVSFDVNRGEIVLIMGPSGSGKTTLLSMIGGLLTPTSGNVLLNDVDLTRLSRHRLSVIRLREIGFVFQSFNLLQNLTARENIQYVGELAGLSPKESRKKTQSLLERLHLDDRQKGLPHELSGGQQQRVSIARALMNEPNLILADEPTGNLDSRSGHEVMMLFHNIAKEENRTVIIVSHDQRIKDIADRTLWIEDGRISKAPPEPESFVRDPMCGMRVDRRYTPFSIAIKEEEFKFCSEDCLKKFKNKQKFSSPFSRRES